MSGRGRGYRGGRSSYGRGQGRGRGGRFNNRQRSRHNGQRNSEMKFAPNSNGGRQTKPFATVKDALVQKLQAKGENDVAESLRTMKELDLQPLKPQRRISGKEKSEDKKIEQEGIDMEHTVDYEKWKTRAEEYEKGLVTAYAWIMEEYCTTSMRSRIEEHPDFNTTIRNNPIVLLETIQAMSAQTVRAQYPYISMNKALKDLQNVSQYHDEQLLDYVKRFKQLRDVAVSYIGTDVLKEFIENSKDYTTERNGTKKKKMKEEAFDRWMAYLLIHGSDQDKYGSLINNFVAQFSLGHDQYPVTIQAATDALSNHKWDSKYYEKKQKRREKQREERQDTGDDDNVTSFAQKATFCYCCGADDHISTYCPKINSIAKKDWYVNKMHQHLQGQQDEETEYTADDDSHSTTSRNRRSGPGTETTTTWNGFQRSGLFHFFQQKFQQFFDKQILTEKPEQVLKQCTKPEQPTNLRKVWLLDCDSTLKATICNPDFATNIRPSKNPIGMETNAGTTQLNMECDIPGRCTKPGEAWYDPQQLTNIFGFGSMADDYHVTYDNNKEDAFIIHSSDGRTIKFERTPEGLYAYTPSTDYLDDIAKLKKLTPSPTEMSHLVSTVKEMLISFHD